MISKEIKENVGVERRKNGKKENNNQEMQTIQLKQIIDRLINVVNRRLKKHLYENLTRHVYDTRVKFIILTSVSSHFQSY